MIFGIVVKGPHKAKAEILKAVIAQQRRAQAADADQHRLGLVVPAQKSFDGGNQFGNVKTDARRAHRAGHGQILAHNHRLQIMHARQHGAGNMFLALRLQDAQQLQIRRHPLDARQTGFARPGRVPEHGFGKGGLVVCWNRGGFAAGREQDVGNGLWSSYSVSSPTNDNTVIAITI